MMVGERAEKAVCMKNKYMLHMRPMQRVAETASKFESEIRLFLLGESWNAKSITDMLLFAATMVYSQQEACVLKASGADANEAVEALSDLIEKKLFSE